MARGKFRRLVFAQMDRIDNELAGTPLLSQDHRLLSTFADNRRVATQQFDSIASLPAGR
jgi:hypothetical protein